MNKINQHFKRGINVQADKKLESPIKRYDNIEKYRRYRLENRLNKDSLLKLSSYHNNLAGI
jgi:hypothetical protein